MFSEKKLMFLYTVSPVHMGAGTSLGVIDNPIQRERHTEHPVFAGSGIKGAMRHMAWSDWKTDDKTLETIFGPDTKDANKHAGAISFSDAQIVTFPVRSLRGGFVYITCPLALNRLKRLMSLKSNNATAWNVPDIKNDDEAILINDGLLTENKPKLVIENYILQKKNTSPNGLDGLAKKIATEALPQTEEFKFFKEKLENDLVLLTDTMFSFFVRNSTTVEPHVKIDDATGTAEDGGLFITECLPPESIMVSLAMASQDRVDGKSLDANGIMSQVVGAFNGKMLQIGGDATTGRGQVVLNFV